MGGSRPLFCSTLWVLVCVWDPQPIFHDLHPIFLALPWPAQPHPLFLECHTGMGAENWRLCVFSSPPTLHYVKSLIHLLWCHRRYCWSWATLSPRQTSPAPAVSVHKESAVIPGSLVAWAGLAAVGPSLPWVLSKVWPNKHWAGGGKTPALPCPALEPWPGCCCCCSLLPEHAAGSCSACRLLSGPSVFSGNCWAQPPCCLPT